MLRTHMYTCGAEVLYVDIQFTYMFSTDSHCEVVGNIKCSAVLEAVIKSRGSIAGV